MNMKVEDSAKHLTLTHTITIMVQEFRAFDIEKYHLSFIKVSLVEFKQCVYSSPM